MTPCASTRVSAPILSYSDSIAEWTGRWRFGTGCFRTLQSRQSAFSLELRSALSRNAPSYRQAWKWACLIGFILVGGCGTIDSQNIDSKPWNRPTKADVSDRWWHDLRQSYWNGPGGHYP